MSLRDSASGASGASLAMDSGHPTSLGQAKPGTQSSNNKGHRGYRERLDFDAIIAARSKDLQTQPDNVLALLQRAYCYFKQGRLDLAMEDYESALQREPQNVDATYYRGVLHDRSGRLDQAIADFSHVLNLAPNHVKASYALAACRNRKGDFLLAIEAYNYALECDKQASSGRRAHRRHPSGMDAWESRLGSSMTQDSRGGTRPGSSHSCSDSSSMGGSDETGPGVMRGMAALDDSASSRKAFEAGSSGSSTCDANEQQDQIQLRRSSSTGAVASSRPAASTKQQLTHTQSKPHGPGLLHNQRVEALAAKSLLLKRQDSVGRTDMPAADESGVDTPMPASRPERPSQSRGPGDASQQPGRRFSNAHNSMILKALDPHKQPPGPQQKQPQVPQPQLFGERRFSGAYSSAAVDTQELRAPAVSHSVLTSANLDTTDLVAVEQQMEVPLEAHWGSAVPPVEHDGSTHPGAVELSSMSMGGGEHVHGFQPRVSSSQLSAHMAPAEAVSSRGTTKFSSTGGVLSEGDSDAARRLKAAEYHHALGLAYRKQGSYLEAIEEYSRALALNPHHFKSHFNKAFSYDKLGDYARAVEEYSAAIRCEPRNSFAYYNRGITRDRLGDFAGAVADFSAAITLDPSSADFYHNRGFSYRKEGMLEEAISDYTSAIELSPNHCRAYYNRAFCHDRLNHVEEAIMDYTRALDLEPSNATAFHRRGALFERIGRFQDAIADYTSALCADPSNALSFYTRGLLLMVAGQPQEALPDLDDALRLMPDNAAFHRSRAQCKRSLSDLAGAVADFSRAIQLDSTDLVSHTQRGHCFRKLGEFEAAIKDYSRALALSEDNSVRLYTNRAYCYAKLGCYTEAVNDYNRVLELDPDNAHAMHNRGISLDKLGLIDRAVRDFNRVMQLEVPAAGGPGEA